MPRAAAIALFATVIACGGTRAAHTAADGDLESQIAEARYAIAADPDNMAAHVRLARLYGRADRPGGALRHFEIAEREGKLGRADQNRLAELYRNRAGARRKLGDAGALDDLVAAQKLDPGGSGVSPTNDGRRARRGRAWRPGGSGVSPTNDGRRARRGRAWRPGTRVHGDAEVYFLAAVAALRRADRDDRLRAVELLGKAEKLAPGDGRLAVLDPDGADTRSLGIAASWAYGHGARRVALELYELYVARDGRQREHLVAWMDVYRWWYGTRKRPGLLLLRELQAAGLNLCPFAREPDELGCSDSLLRIIGDPDTENMVRRHAAAQSWRTDESEPAAAWTAIALRAWISGDVPSWLGELSRRVDVDALAGEGADPDVIPLFAAPSLLRAAGRDADARTFFDRALERAAALAPAERAVLIAEAAAQGRGPAVVDAVLAASETDPLAWRIALRDAHARADSSREASLLADAPPAIALDHARATDALGVVLARWPQLATEVERRAAGKWWRALKDEPLVTARDAVANRWLALAGQGTTFAPAQSPTPLALGLSDPSRLAAELGVIDVGLIAGLARIARAYLDDPAIADRLAGDLVDGAIAVGQRGPVVAELFARLGDPARSSQWHRQVLASSKNHWPYLMAAGIAEAATKDLSRADVLLVHAAALSGDAGDANLQAARGYVRHGAALEAIGAGRRALQLTAPGLQADVMEILVEAMFLLSRDTDASSVLVASTEQVPDRFRDAARADALAMWGSRPPVEALSGPVWRSRREREILGEAEPVDDPMDPRVASDTRAALRWNPGEIAGRSALLAERAIDESAQHELIAELLAIGLAAERPKAVEALSAAAAALDARGFQDLAERARLEAKALR